MQDWGAHIRLRISARQSQSHHRINTGIEIARPYRGCMITPRCHMRVGEILIVVSPVF